LPLARGATWSRWWHTLKLLLVRPGQLTWDYAHGKRQPYVPALSLFLAINVVFFLAQSFSGLNVLSIPLKAHIDNQGYSSIAKPFAERRAAQRLLPSARFEDRFNLQQETLAKATVLAMVPVFAGMSALLLRKSRQRFATHWVFSLHFYAFLLLLLAVTFSLLGPCLRLLKQAGWDVGNPAADNLISGFEGLAIATYLTLASARAFAVRWWPSVVSAVVLTFTVLGALYLHRMAMLWVTAWLV
jgi:Protein of unknown function (DUF3667)